VRALILLAVVGLMTAARSFQVAGASLGSATALSVGYLLLSAYLLGHVAKQLRLPKLTGYLGAGLMAGASGFDFLPHAALDDLKIFTGVAVALIALTAGTELELRAMRPLARTILWLTLIAVVGTALLLAGATVLMSSFLPFMAGLEFQEILAIALVLGVVMSAQSPAVVVALRTELAADGPVCRTVLGVVVIADLVVILLFAITSTFATSVFGAGASTGSTLVHVAWELLGSVVAGAGIAAILTLFLRRISQGTPMFVLMVCFVVAEVGARIGLDPLIVALSAGILIRNLTNQGEALHHAIEGSALPVYLVFFAVAGATIHLDVLAIVGLPALAFVLVRAFGFLGGASVATRISGAPPVVRRWVGFGLLPQAGLALALSMLFARTFPQFGADAGAMTLGVVALNELVAPVLYRWALVRSGEAGRLDPSASGSAQLLDVRPDLSSEALPFKRDTDPMGIEIADAAIAAGWPTTASASASSMPAMAMNGPWDSEASGPVSIPPPRRSTLVVDAPQAPTGTQPEQTPSVTTSLRPPPVPSVKPRQG
jgi:Kef-type K+ transport system membrane component KefB